MSPELRASHFSTILWFLLLLVLAGTIGYMVVEGWGFLDALFMTVTTLTTVGYGEVHPLSKVGQIYTIVLILVGVGLLIYILTSTAELMVEANPTAYFIRRRMKERISGITKDTRLSAASAATGYEVARLFEHHKLPFVVVEQRSGARQAS